MSDIRAKEAALRRFAIRMGMELQTLDVIDIKSPRVGGYMLVNLTTGDTVFGDDPIPFTATLAEVEDWLTYSVDQDQLADGRPFQMPADVVEALDKFRSEEPDNPARPEAMERLLRDHLVGLGYLPMVPSDEELN